MFLAPYRIIKDLFPSFVRVPASGSVTAVLSTDKSNYVTCRLRMRSKGVFDWWELTQKSPDPLFGAKENVLEMITFNDLVPPLHFSFFTSTGYLKLNFNLVLKQRHMKLPLSRLHSNGHTLGLEPPCRAQIEVHMKAARQLSFEWSHTRFSFANSTVHLV